jgi:peptidoglycan/LPS O-acetylase OafA/YrhL
MNRLYNLDYLRGLAAFGIMIYHYLSWTLGKFSADTFMGRLGIYGVSIFYVLSGLTLYYVYYDKMKPSKEDIVSFFKKRIFRIFPLLWLVTIVAIILSKKSPDFYSLFLNLSGLFGFIKWDTYFSVGVWSIGNELVFYAFFPFFILFSKSYKPLMALLAITILGLYLYFAFNKLNQDLTLSEQWRNYVNPLNQVFLFLGGFLIGRFLHNVKIKNSIIITLLLLGLSLFIFYPVTGDTINLVTGVNRLIFTACCFLICISFYKMTFTLPKFIHKPLTLLGEASYSVYLLHPIVYSVTGIALTISSKYLFHFPESVRRIISVISTLIISYFVYQRFEKHFMKLGMANKNNPA